MEHEVPDMEMIIIKRGYAQEEHPHGGAWKVAFADFMTAMMAFFLVLWIVNSTNKETRSSVARYFNPIRLSDTTVARKGLKDPREVDFDASASSEDKAHSKVTTTVSGSEGQDISGGGKGGQGSSESTKDAALTGSLDPINAQDPFIVLDEIAGQKTGAFAPEDRAGSADYDLLDDGPQLYRDPFAPPAPVLPPEAKPALRIAPNAAAPTPNSPSPTPSRNSKTAAIVETAASERVALDAQAMTKRLRADAEAANAMDAKDTKVVKDAKVGKDGKAALMQQAVTEAANLRESITRVLNEVGLAQGPKLDVRAVDDGILVSLTDDFNFGMFAVGSAEPQPRVVRAMERIGQLLSAQPGTFVVRGHTDARPYKSRAYDNWRLSSARAQMAAYMLMRGKVDEHRIERIEGHADRSLRNTAEPLAAENRRIEILLRRAK